MLYVAMTRPKEKLIMTGMASKLESRVKQCAAHAGRQEELLSYQTLSSASGYLDWICRHFRETGVSTGCMNNSVWQGMRTIRCMQRKFR